MAGSLVGRLLAPPGGRHRGSRGQQPIAAEFNRALVEARLGVPIEDALDGVAERMRSKDFAWVVMAIRIQREVGGNLAELLPRWPRPCASASACAARSRPSRPRDGSRPGSSGPAASCSRSTCSLARPAYLNPLVTDPLGLADDRHRVILLIVGALWMRKVVKVEV